MNVGSSGRLSWTALLLAVWLVVACQSNSSADATPSPAAGVDAAVGEPASATTSPTAAPTAAGVGDEQNADANVEFVRAVQAQDGSWTFHVTVRHPDTGWEDYADGWDVLTPDGNVLKVSAADPFTRLLLHPHENEQPFTRSQNGIEIPENVGHVIVRAHDIVDGYGGKEVAVDLSVSEGEAFSVERP